MIRIEGVQLNADYQIKAHFFLFSTGGNMIHPFVVLEPELVRMQKPVVIEFGPLASNWTPAASGIDDEIPHFNLGYTQQVLFASDSANPAYRMGEHFVTAQKGLTLHITLRGPEKPVIALLKTRDGKLLAEGRGNIPAEILKTSPSFQVAA